MNETIKGIMVLYINNLHTCGNSSGLGGEGAVAQYMVSLQLAAGA